MQSYPARANAQVSRHQCLTQAGASDYRHAYFTERTHSCCELKEINNARSDFTVCSMPACRTARRPMASTVLPPSGRPSHLPPRFHRTNPLSSPTPRKQTASQPETNPISNPFEPKFKPIPLNRPERDMLFHDHVARILPDHACPV